MFLGDGRTLRKSTRTWDHQHHHAKPHTDSNLSTESNRCYGTMPWKAILQITTYFLRHFYMVLNTMIITGVPQNEMQVNEILKSHDIQTHHNLHWCPVLWIRDEVFFGSDWNIDEVHYSMLEWKRTESWTPVQVNKESQQGGIKTRVFLKLHFCFSSSVVDFKNRWQFDAPALPQISGTFFKSLDL